MAPSVLFYSSCSLRYARRSCRKVFKGKVVGHSSHLRTSVGSWAALLSLPGRGDKPPPADGARGSSRARARQPVLAAVLGAGPSFLSVPGAAAARGWQRVPFSLTLPGCTLLRPSAALCPDFLLLFSHVPLRFLVTGSELPRGPPQQGQKPHTLLGTSQERPALRPALPVPQ